MRKQDWAFITSHAEALLRIAHDPDVRVADLAAQLHLSERATYNVLADLCDAGYLVRSRSDSGDSRHSHYRLNRDVRLRGRMIETRTLSALLALLEGAERD